MKRSIILTVLSLSICLNTSTGAVPVIGKEKKFLFEDKLKSESLSVKIIGKNKISFQLFLNNKSTGSKVFINGIAFSNPNIEDPEIDSDDTGEAYAVEEFFFEKKCGLSIRIEADNFSAAKIYESTCMRNKYLSRYGISFDCKKTMKSVKFK